MRRARPSKSAAFPFVLIHVLLSLAFLYASYRIGAYLRTQDVLNQLRFPTLLIEIFTTLYQTPINVFSRLHLFRAVQPLVFALFLILSSKIAKLTFSSDQVSFAYLLLCVLYLILFVVKFPFWEYTCWETAGLYVALDASICFAEGLFAAFMPAGN